MDPILQDRYSRQINLNAIGEAGQQTLQDSHAFILGLGGLGSPVALYLAAAGVGTLTLCDYDIVDESNLQRQIIHHQNQVGQLKTTSAASHIQALNPHTKLHTLDYEPDEEELLSYCKDVNILVDCTDNFPSRFMINRLSRELQLPLVSGAAIRFEGQITSYDPRQEASPCYRCLYNDTGAENMGCDIEGVAAPIVGIIGTMQAQLTLNLLLGLGDLTGRLLLFDGQYLEWQQMQIPKNPRCPECGHPADNAT